MTMKKIFENVVLGEFVATSGKEPFVSFQAESGKEQKERLLKTFFKKQIAPLFYCTEVEDEVKKMKPKDKANFAASVIAELYRCVIEPKVAQGGETPDVSFAVTLMALFFVRNPRKEPFVRACQAVRLEAFAPNCNPALRPNRVRTFGEELELQGHLQKLEEWSKVFSQMCKNVCKP